MRTMSAHRQPPQPPLTDNRAGGVMSGAAGYFPFDFGREARIAMGVGGIFLDPPTASGSPREMRGFGWCERQFGRRNQPEPHHMAKSRTSKTALPNAKPSSKSTPTRVTRSQHTPVSTRANTMPAPPVLRSEPSQRATKQNACLRLLARSDGATIEDLKSATGWQSHSIRGFLAGTVKKKLGLTLVSSKADGDLRRYRVVEAGARRR